MPPSQTGARSRAGRSCHRFEGPRRAGSQQSAVAAIRISSLAKKRGQLAVGARLSYQTCRNSGYLTLDRSTGSICNSRTHIGSRRDGAPIRARSGPNDTHVHVIATWVDLEGLHSPSQQYAPCKLLHLCGRSLAKVEAPEGVKKAVAQRMIVKVKFNETRRSV